MPRVEPTDDVSRAGASTFEELTDTPATLTGQSRQILRVNPGAAGLQFVAELADLVVGNGFNVLRVVNNGGTLEMNWFDIQQLIIDITGANDRRIEGPILAIPVPTISNTVLAPAAQPAQADSLLLSVTAPSVSNLTSAPAAATPESEALTLAAPIPSVLVSTAIT